MKNGPVDFFGDGPFAPQGPRQVPYEAMPALLAQYETFVFLPTVIEPFGRLVAEAWAAGCEIVTNGQVGARWWIEDEPGRDRDGSRGLLEGRPRHDRSGDDRGGWDHAAREDAMFNIITFADKANGGWTAEEFFAHGQVEIDAAMDRLKTLHLGEGHGRALDFGCGIGRLTQALANHYDRVDGVDISQEMVTLAVEHDRHGCTYHVNQTEDLALFEDDTFDLVYSMIVLQHMPQHLQRGYVREFFRVLKPGGVAMFEMPDGPNYRHPNGWLSMYGVARLTVEGWIAEAGGTLVDVELIPEPSVWQCLRYTAVAS